MSRPIHAIVFDAYGTLFNVHSVIRRCEEIFPGRGETLSRLWRGKQLEYTWLRSLMGRYEDFESITRDALNYVCGSLDLPLPDDGAKSLMEEYRRLEPYAEVPATLDSLRGRKLAILSNGSPAMLEDMVRNAGLAPAFDAVLSVDALRIYKPHPSIYQLAVDRLGSKAEHIAFVSSNYWDAAGATSFGFRTFWINRAGTQPDELGYAPYRSLSRLDELAKALAAD
jgi:2-haloacid dehalogenase